MRALQEDALVGRELSVTTYLVGELNRRLGNHREALNWYVNAGRTTEGDPRVAWLDRLIDQAEQARQRTGRLKKASSPKPSYSIVSETT